MNDLIDRQDAIAEFYKYPNMSWTTLDIMNRLSNMPSAQLESLTDNEQRIFLAAMGREEEVCKRVDEEYPGKPYENTLVWICKEITRKVKGALWT